jgi:hypothetical protein
MIFTILYINRYFPSWEGVRRPERGKGWVFEMINPKYFGNLDLGTWIQECIGLRSPSSSRTFNTTIIFVLLVPE